MPPVTSSARRSFGCWTMPPTTAPHAAVSCRATASGGIASYGVGAMDCRQPARSCARCRRPRPRRRLPRRRSPCRRRRRRRRRRRHSSPSSLRPLPASPRPPTCRLCSPRSSGRVGWRQVATRWREMAKSRSRRSQSPSPWPCPPRCWWRRLRRPPAGLHSARPASRWWDLRRRRWPR